jgi:hypothetical protein
VPRQAAATRLCVFSLCFCGVDSGTLIAYTLGMWLHLVARSFPRWRPLTGFEPCAWLWERLRRSFPSVLSCVLMPDGLHLVVRCDKPADAHHRLVAVLRGFTRRYGNGQRLFEPVPKPALVPNRLHQWRTSRYVPLNPSRAGYVKDPLAWLWSTYRDVLGATADPWVTAEQLALAHDRCRHGFEAVFHGYVSGDPTVALAGTPLPLPAAPTKLSRFPLEQILLASAATHRVQASTVLHQRQPRRLFVALARDQGWATPVIADACGLTMQGVRRISVAPGALAGARLCLGDDRLRIGVNDL